MSANGRFCGGWVPESSRVAFRFEVENGGGGFSTRCPVTERWVPASLTHLDYYSNSIKSFPRLGWTHGEDRIGEGADRLSPARADTDCISRFPSPGYSVP